jgi:hypothetical protein
MSELSASAMTLSFSCADRGPRRSGATARRRTRGLATAVWKMRLVLPGRLRRMELLNPLLSAPCFWRRRRAWETCQVICQRAFAHPARQKNPPAIHESHGGYEREGQEAPSTGNHPRVVPAVVGFGVVEFESLLDGAVVPGRVLFEVPYDRGGDRVVDRPRRTCAGHRAGARDTVAASASQLSCASLSTSWRMDAHALSGARARGRVRGLRRRFGRSGWCCRGGCGAWIS